MDIETLEETAKEFSWKLGILASGFGIGLDNWRLFAVGLLLMLMVQGIKR